MIFISVFYFPKAEGQLNLLYLLFGFVPVKLKHKWEEGSFLCIGLFQYFIGGRCLVPSVSDEG